MKPSFGSARRWYFGGQVTWKNAWLKSGTDIQQLDPSTKKTARLAQEAVAGLF